jgi:hypothetical protein
MTIFICDCKDDLPPLASDWTDDLSSLTYDGTNNLSSLTYDCKDDLPSLEAGLVRQVLDLLLPLLHDAVSWRRKRKESKFRKIAV